MALKETLVKYRELIRFTGLALLLLLAWVLTLAFLPGVVHAMHFYLIKFQAVVSAGLLSLSGFPAGVEYEQGNCLARIVMDRGGVCVGTGCSGLELFFLFAAFVLLLKGNRKEKPMFILAGLLIILILNIVRIAALALIHNFRPEYLQFNHKYTFVIFMYAVIFALWMYWVKKIDKKRRPDE